MIHLSPFRGHETVEHFVTDARDDGVTLVMKTREQFLMPDLTRFIEGVFDVLRYEPLFSCVPFPIEVVAHSDVMVEPFLVPHQLDVAN